MDYIEERSANLSCRALQRALIDIPRYKTTFKGKIKTVPSTTKLQTFHHSCKRMANQLKILRLHPMIQNDHNTTNNDMDIPLVKINKKVISYYTPEGRRIAVFRQLK